MRIGSPLPHKRARIEIIPLIDIMFFLLASFMLASLSMIRLESVKVDLPAAATAKKDFKPDILNIAVKANGEVYYEKKLVSLGQLQNVLSNAYQRNTNVPVYISGDREAKHGTIVQVLDVVRREGIQKVSFAISAAQQRPASP
jgi:biopolymer transport protein ExbD